MSQDKIRSRTIFGIITGGAVLLLASGFRTLSVLTNPILIMNEDSAATVLIDGKELALSQGVGQVTPWNGSYLLEVRRLKGVEKRRIYPDGQSESVVIKRNAVQYYVKNSPVE